MPIDPTPASGIEDTPTTAAAFTCCRASSPSATCSAATRASSIAMRGDLATAAPFIGFAVVLDMLDGRIARMTNTTSAFGLEFDSLADVISFGLAPAILAFAWGLSELGRRGVGRGLHLRHRGRDAPGALQHPDRRRTARQALLRRHAVARRRGRRGGDRLCLALPTVRPGAGASPRSLVVLVPAALMVSTIRFRSFKTINFGWSRRTCTIILIAGLIALDRHRAAITLVMLAYGYLLSAFIEMGITRLRTRTGSRRRRQRDRHHRALRLARSSSAIVPPQSSILRFAFASPRPDPPVFVEKYGSNARVDGVGVHTDAGVGDRRSSRRHLAAARERSACRRLAWPGPRSRRDWSARARATSGRRGLGGSSGGTSTSNCDRDRQPDAVALRRPSSISSAIGASAQAAAPVAPRSSRTPRRSAAAAAPA